MDDICCNWNAFGGLWSNEAQCEWNYHNQSRNVVRQFECNDNSVSFVWIFICSDLMQTLPTFFTSIRCESENLVKQKKPWNQWKIKKPTTWIPCDRWTVFQLKQKSIDTIQTWSNPNFTTPSPPLPSQFRCWCDHYFDIYFY